MYLFGIASVHSGRPDVEVLSCLFIGSQDLNHEVEEADDTIHLVEFRDWIQKLSQAVEVNGAPCTDGEDERKNGDSH